MIINIKPLYNNIVNMIDINEIINFDESYLKTSSIKKLDKVAVKGTIYIDITEEIIIDLKVNGEMILINSVNLNDVNYPFDITIKENIEEFIKEDEFTLDIFEIVWQYIILEIPMRVVDKNTDFNLSGDGWELFKED